MHDDEYADLLKAFNNLRRFSLDKKPHIKEYNKIRKIHGEIVNAMVKFYHNSEYVQKPTSDSAYQYRKDTIVRLLKCNFDINTRLGAQGLYDIFIYKTTPNLSCITEDFIKSKRFRKPEKIEFLHSMLDSNIGLFEITGTDLDEGYAYIKEIFTGKEYRIIDIGLSGEPNYRDFYVYTRIITHHGISFGSGLNLVFNKTDDFINKHIKYHKKNYSPSGEFIRFTELYNYLNNNPEKDKVVLVT